MKSVRVGTICEKSPMGGLILSATTPLREAIAHFAGDIRFQSIFVIDKNERFTGVVSNHDLLDWARLQFDLERDHKMTVGKIRRLLGAQTLGDLILPESKFMAVQMNDTLGQALVKMARYELEDIAVLNEEGAIVQDLRLSEVLSAALSIEGFEAS